MMSVNYQYPLGLALNVLDRFEVGWFKLSFTSSLINFVLARPVGGSQDLAEGQSRL